MPDVESEVVLRGATEADVPAVVDLYASLSKQSARMRFFGSMPSESLEAAAALAGDHSDAVSVLALVEGQVVGEARYVVHGDGVHELGIAVADRFQQRGVGRRLLDRLRQEAAARGVEALRATVRIDNLPMLKTLRSVGCAVVEPVDEGLLTVELSCVDAMPGWSPATSGRRVLVEHVSFWDPPGTADLRAAGFEVRQCPGPRRGTAQTCPLVVSGRCRLAQEADLIACLLPEDDPSCREVVRHHAARRPARLAARSPAEWEILAARLVGS